MDTQREVYEILAELEAVLTTTDACRVLTNIASVKSNRTAWQPVAANEFGLPEYPESPSPVSRS